jgi:hypothetical protein
MSTFRDIDADSTADDLRNRPHIEIVIATHPTDPEAVDFSVRCDLGPRPDLVIGALMEIAEELKRRANRGDYLP